MDFYDRVKELIKLNNLSLQPFFESLGIDYVKYRGQRRYGNLPRANESVKIAQALNTTVEYLVTGKSTEQEDKLHNAIAEIQSVINKYK